MKLETIKTKRKLRYFGKVPKEKNKIEGTNGTNQTANDVKSKYVKDKMDMSERLPPINIKPLTKLGMEKATEQESKEVIIPPGIICNSCAKIGIYVRNEDIQKAIQQSSNQKLMKEKCIVCKTYQNRNYNEGHLDISDTVLYSHNFYDQYSRETKPVSVKNDSGDSVINERKEEKNLKERNEVERKYIELSGDVYEAEDRDRDRDIFEKEEEASIYSGSEALSMVKEDEFKQDDKFFAPSRREMLSVSKCSFITPSAIRLPQIPTRSTFHHRVTSSSTISKDINIHALSARSLIIEPVETDTGDHTERSKKKLPVLSVASLRKEVEPKPSEKLPTNSKKYSEMYFSVYQKRALKGSTVRRSETLKKLGKDQPRHTHYSIDCLGLTFGIPDFNFSLAGRKIHNPNMAHNRARPTSLDPLEKKSLLPPLGKAIRPPFPMQTS